jgi:hypothetical protein
VRRRVLLLVGFVVVFAIGIALGEALHDNPKPGGEETHVRLLKPLPLAPAALQTVTVTTTSP